MGTLDSIVDWLRIRKTMPRLCSCFFGRQGTRSILSAWTRLRALAQALNKNWDIMISDHSMPHFSGTEALKIVRAHGRLTFLLFSFLAPLAKMWPRTL